MQLDFSQSPLKVRLRVSIGMSPECVRSKKRFSKVCLWTRASLEHCPLLIVTSRLAISWLRAVRKVDMAFCNRSDRDKRIMPWMSIIMSCSKDFSWMAATACTSQAGHMSSNCHLSGLAAAPPPLGCSLLGHCKRLAPWLGTFRSYWK